MAAPLMLSVSGCRGVVGESLTPEVATRFAASYAAFLRERAGGAPVTVVVGRDGRAGGHMVHAAAVAGLTAAGATVVDLGVAMTPTTAVMTDEYARRGADNTAGGQPGGLVGGLVITASHNPQQWNGLKCLLAEGGAFGSAACAPPAALANKIIGTFSSTQPVPMVGWEALGAVYKDQDGPEAHTARVMTAMEACGLTDDATQIGHGLRAAVDSVNGSGQIGARLLLEELGCDEFLQIGASDDGIFHHPPEPTSENLSLPGGLCDAVRSAHADVGFAQDPDADRLALIDETGRYIGEEYTLALCAMAILEGFKAQNPGATPGPLVTNLSTSRMLDDVAARYGSRVLRTPVGEANVVETMKAQDAIAGGEGNGGIIWPRVAYVRDSLAGMALVLWLLSPQGGGRGTKRTLSEVVASIPSYAIRKRKVDLLRREDAAPGLERLAKAYGQQHVDLRDGVWVDMKTGPLAGKAWLHVRASNTEPIVRLIAEAPTQAQADALLDEAGGILGG